MFHKSRIPPPPPQKNKSHCCERPYMGANVDEHQPWVPGVIVKIHPRDPHAE